MGHSSLLGAESAALEPAGRDTASLGPGDNSDSGSDVAGLDPWADTADAVEPVDVALRENRQRSAVAPDALSSSSDAAGTGERRSAAADAGFREAADISADEVFDTADETAAWPAQDLPDADALIDPEDLEGAEAQQPASEADMDEARHRGENESADPVGDGHSDAELARRLQRRRLTGA